MKPEAPTTTPYRQLLRHVRQTNLLASTQSLLNWDQRTMMPRGGTAPAYRGEQLAQLAGMIHRMRTDPRLGDWLDACESDDDLTADPAAPAAVNLREVRRAYDRAVKLPGGLVEQFTRTGTMSNHAWVSARKHNTFETFAPWLQQMIDLNRERADCWGWDEDGEPWDALAEGYEPGMRAATVADLFDELRPPLVELTGELMRSPDPPSNGFNEVALTVADQRRFVREVVERVGFDFSRGRLDRSAHPFCGGTHRDDVRLTTRFHPQMLNDGLGSTLHECGHGLYQQNLPGGEHLNTPMGRPASLAIHESQSRLIENFVGRSRAFWVWCEPRLRVHFNGAFDHLGFEDIYGGANIVQPGLIRVESDELTYNLHIMVRFELERAMLRGDLTADDLPLAWNEKYRDYLAIDVPDDARGCMQDVHWSQGAMGYFPTYTLGNLYAGQFFETLLGDVPDLYEHFERGDFAPLVSWLAEHIHAHGMRHRAADLCEHVTGKPLSITPFLTHVRDKLRPLYGL